MSIDPGLAISGGSHEAGTMEVAIQWDQTPCLNLVFFQTKLV